MKTDSNGFWAPTNTTIGLSEYPERFTGAAAPKIGLPAPDRAARQDKLREPWPPRLLTSPAFPTGSDSAHYLHRRLKLSGLETWIDFEKLDLDSDIDTQLEAAITSSSTLLFLDTPSARLSPWTRFEIAVAEKANVPILQIQAAPAIPLDD